MSNKPLLDHHGEPSEDIHPGDPGTSTLRFSYLKASSAGYTQSFHDPIAHAAGANLIGCIPRDLRI